MISSSKAVLKANKQIKINAKGKFLGTVMGDNSGAPAESYTWGKSPTINKKITKNNLKMCPLFKNGEKDYEYVVPHPLYSKDNTELKEFIYHCTKKSYMHVTDDTFFSGEAVNAGLQIFCSKNANKKDINEKCRDFYDQYAENLRQFAAKQEHKGMIYRECGSNARKFLFNEKTNGTSDKDGSVMRIGQMASFADSLSDFNKIVLAIGRSTHYHQYSFDAARAVGSAVYLSCRCGLWQKSIANYIALEFARRYTKKPPVIKDDYGNGVDFFNFKMYSTVREVYAKRNGCNYSETALDNAVIALRIICVAGSFLEAWRLTKAYAADADTLQAIVLSIAAFMFGIPEEFQEEARKVLRNHASQDIRGYEKTSDEFDQKCSDCYRENIPLKEQLKNTLEMLKYIEKNESRDMVDINNEIGFNDGKQPFNNYKTVKEEDLKVDCPEWKNFLESVIANWNFNLSPDTHYNRNQRKLYEYEPDGKLPENASKDDLEKYKWAEEKYYSEVNQHNLSTAEFQDKIKMDKLKALTIEDKKEINKTIDKINQIAKRWQVDAKIEKLSLEEELQSYQETVSITKKESKPQTINLSQNKERTNEKEDIQETTDDSSDYSNQVDQCEGSLTFEATEPFVDTISESPYKYFWDDKRKTAILVFVVVPATLIIAVFCLLPFGISATVSGSVTLLNLLVFWLTSKIYSRAKKPTNLVVVSKIPEPKEEGKDIKYKENKLPINPEIKNEGASKDANK